MDKKAIQVEINPKEIAKTDSSDLSALVLYGQDIRRFSLIDGTQEATLGRQINSVIGQLLTLIATSASGLEWLEGVITDHLAKQLRINGEPAKRWDVPEHPSIIENQIITLIDTLKVIQYLSTANEADQANPTELHSQLIERVLQLNLSRQIFIEMCQIQAATRAPQRSVFIKLTAQYDRLRHKLISSNLRLVYRVAAKYRELGVSFEDLLQDGNLGLIKAADRFNFAKGYRFSTYAYWCIDTALKNALQKRYHLISRPVHLQAKLSRIRGSVQAHLHKYNREPNLDELSSATDIPLSTLQAIAAFPQTPLSLSLPLQNEDGATLDMFLADPNAQTETKLYQSRQKRLLNSLAQVLTRRERQVLEMRFGIECHTEHTLQQIATQLNVSTERVRQIQHSALDKLQQRADQLQSSRCHPELDH
ncbi:sigma-70 family RNA polymerase sigma factor [Pontibacter sp. JAM-7]|uniref:sigma-70 family RNA polymerase sigma factor n=1 Tax=Pontibacter sp. JAM-7 TaxID=3366581 RepID=UPI003AF6C746